MTNFYTLPSGIVRRTLAFVATLFMLICFAGLQEARAEANYVYHEQTTNNPGCGPNYMSTTSPLNSAGLQIAWKIEYQFWTTNTVVYYTTDGSNPSGSFGAPSGTSQVLTGSYNCTFGGSPVDVATATIPAQPAGTTVKYIISAWHSGGGNEIFANGPGAPCGCGTPTSNSSLATVFSYTVSPSATNVVEVVASAATKLGTYTTLKGAFDAINAGTHQGSININIYGNTTETATAAINASGGTASYTSITIAPKTTVRTITGSIVGAIIKLNGADNVTIDGRIGGSGNNLNVTNTNTSAATAAIWVSSNGVALGATNNIIRNLNIACGADQSTSTNSTFGIIQCGTTISTTANGDDNDNNQYLYNNITKCRYGITTRGNTTNLNLGIIVSNNIIGPASFGSNQIGKVGIFMQADQGAIVSNNTVQFVGGQYANTTAGADRIGIAIGNESWSTAPSTITSNSYTVTNNIIHDIIDERTFSAVGLLMATTGGGSPTNNVAANNLIYNVRSNGTAGDQTVGLGISGGHSDKVVFNSIYLSGDVDPNPSASASTNYGSGIRIANANGTTHLNLTLMNNIVSLDLSSSSGPTVRYYAISGNSSAYSFGTGGENYNAYYINPSNPQLMTGGLGSTSGVALTTQFATLANWQAAYTVPQDANSIASQPLFVSSTDLHLQSSGSNAPFNGTGIAIAGVTTDYDGETRGGTPDRGADEFSIPTCTTADGGTVSPAAASACSGATYAMSSTGATSGDGINYQWEVSTTGGGLGFADVTDGTGATSVAYTTGALTSGTFYYRLRVTCVPAGLTGYSNELTLTVNPTPTASAASNSPVCVGAMIELEGTTDVGTIFSWTGPGGYTSSSEDPDIPSAVLANAGTYVFTATLGTCNSAPANTAVVVNTNPTGVSATATPESLCFGQQINLIANVDPMGYTMDPNGLTGFVDIALSGTSVGSLGDDLEYNITMPSFTFNGIAYTNARVGNNGVIALGSSSGEIANGNLALPSTANSAGNILLLPWWDDLDIDFTGEVISTETIGSIFIIQFTNMSHFNYASGGVTFQVQLDLTTGQIHYIYSDVIFGSVTYDAGITATVGLQFSGTSAIQFSFNSASLTNGKCITFTPNSASYSWTGPGGYSSATQNPVIPSATLDNSGVYTVVVTNTVTGCSASANTASVTVLENATYYADADGDTYGDATMTQTSCTGAPGGYVADDTDCDDTDNSVNPGATEICGNSVDDDCDGDIDEMCTVYTFYADTDGDTYGDAADFVTNFTGIAPMGYVADNTDCDDTNSSIYPGATEICNSVDDDCDGTIDDGVLLTFYADADGDTYGNAASTSMACTAPMGYVSDNTDCDDDDDDINPGETEICNGIDDDCSGVADDGPVVFLDYYVDADGDGYGTGSAFGFCEAPMGWSLLDGDCDDADDAINPGETETCNGIDDDCSGVADDGPVVFLDYYVDADGDGYGTGSAFGFCEAPMGWSLLDGDCDDADNAIYPGATEICNGTDDDCDGALDDGLVFTTYYKDNDGDGYGDADYGTATTCDGAPATYVADNTDCEDFNSSINPGATEICNFIDDDCDGTADEGLPLFIFYLDADGDTYGTPFATLEACGPTGPVWVTDNTDCNDGNAAINPAATEICNGTDDDCDFIADDGLTFVSYWGDSDGDGFGDAGVTASTCDGPPAGYVTNDTDCNDSNASVYPGATEVCNGTDDDCDGMADDGLTFTTWYADTDGDTFGDAFNTTSTCDGAPAGYVSDATDCDDTQSTVYPGGTEICDGLDNDCDGEFDEGTASATVSPSGTITICRGTPTPLSANAGVGYTYQWFKNGNIIPGATNMLYNVNKPGYYQVQVNIPEGCFALSAPTVVQVNPNPNANISAPNGTSLCTTVKLKVSYDASYTYLWHQEGAPIPGATSYLYFPAVPGNYNCYITNTYGCSRFTGVITVSACRDIEDGAVVAEVFELYPNPNTGNFTVEMELDTDATTGDIYMQNVIGDIVYAGTISIDHGTVFTTVTLADDIASGMYFVKVIANNKEYSRQVIIQK